MTSSEVLTDYFYWITEKVQDISLSNHQMLFRKLHATNFYAVIELDRNREYDGIDLRYEYGYNRGLSDETITKAFGNRPCSILEMMVALCRRIENQIAYDPTQGDRTSVWFCYMIKNLGLETYDNTKYDERAVTVILDRFLNLEYFPDGRGGLFAIPNPPGDVRARDIWTQMYWFFNTIQ